MSDITLNSAPSLEESSAKPFETKAFQEKWSPKKTLTFTLLASSFLWAVIIATAWQLL